MFAGAGARAMFAGARAMVAGAGARAMVVRIMLKRFCLELKSHSNTYYAIKIANINYIVVTKYSDIT